MLSTSISPRRIRLLATILLVVAAQSVPCAEPPPDPDRLVEALDVIRLEHDIPGAAFALVSRDRVLRVGGLGVADRENLTPVTADTLFRVGSITKAFTALGLLMLEEEGRLRLHDPVTRHLPHPPYRNPWEHTHPVTVAQLLEHTAGLQDLTRAEFDHSDPTPLTLQQAFSVCPPCRTVRWQPGLHAVYSNPGYGVAGQVLEVVAGARYEDFIAQRLFAPLGMRSAGFFLDDETRRRLAIGYDTDARTPIPYWHMLYRPFGGINASAREMAAFVQLLLNEGSYGETRLLPRAAIARMETPRTSLAARNGLGFGYGLGVYQVYRDRVLFHTHGGDGDGYLSRFGYNRDAGLGYFVTINAFRGAALRAMQAEFEHFIARSSTPPSPTPSARIGAAVLREYAGRYRLAAWRFPETAAAELAAQTLTVTLADGVLYTRVGNGRRAALIPVTAQLFRRRDEAAATSAFVRGDDGLLYFQEDENYVKDAPAGAGAGEAVSAPDSTIPASW